MKVEIESKGERITKVFLDGKLARKKQGTTTDHCRQVFRTKNHVVKFDGIDVGPDCCHIQNDKELENYDKIEEHDLKYFAQIVEHDFVDGKLYLIQERVYPVDRNPTANDKTMLEHLKDKYEFLEDVDESTNLFYTEHSFKIYDIGHFGSG